MDSQNKHLWCRLTGALVAALLLLLVGIVQAQAPLPRNLNLDQLRRLPHHILIGAQPALVLAGDLMNPSYHRADSVRGPIWIHCQVGSRLLRDSVAAPTLYYGDHFRYSWSLPPLPLGAHLVRVWYTMPPAYRDTFPASDTVRQLVQVIDSTQTERRLTLIEEFTSSTCNPCLPTATALNQWLQQPGHAAAAVVVAFQQYFPAPGCYYQNSSSRSRGNLYIGAGLPTLSVNARYQADDINDPTLHVASELTDPALVHLDASYYRDPVTGQLTAWVTATPQTDFRGAYLPAWRGTGFTPPTDSPRVYVAWIEPQVPAVNATNGQTVLRHVSHRLDYAPGVALGAAGVPVALGPFTYQPDAADHVVHPDSLQAVVWLQDEAWPRTVLQAVRARRSATPLGVAPGNGQLLVTLVPNPARSGATLHLTLPVAQRVGVAVFDGLGRQVLTVPTGEQPAGALAFPLDLRGLSPGVYAVRLNAGNRLTTRRLMVE